MKREPIDDQHTINGSAHAHLSHPFQHRCPTGTSPSAVDRVDMRASRASVARAEGGGGKQTNGWQAQPIGGNTHGRGCSTFGQQAAFLHTFVMTNPARETSLVISFTTREQAHHMKVNIRSRSQQQPSDLHITDSGGHVKCSQLVHLLQRSHAYAKAAVEAARKVYKHTQYASWCIQSTCCATRPVQCANWGPPLCSEESGQRQCNRRCMQRPGA